MNPMFHCIVGLPRSGKTTFLAALWHIVDAGETSTRLVLDRLVGDHAHLNSIVERWRRCEEVPRTSSLASEAKVTMHLRDSETNQQVALYFPDLAGESFESQFETRRCQESYVDGYANAGGILLFVNADRPTDGLTLLDLGPALTEAASEVPAAPVTPDLNVAAEDATTDEVEWSAALVPEQVRLVDLLQFVQLPPFQRRLRRVAVMISAWDVVSGQGVSPDAWLRREMPLLMQFLENNPTTYEFCAFGISAQGGSVRGAAARDVLLKQVPSARVCCVTKDISGHDLTAPLVWLGEAA